MALLFVLGYHLSYLHLLQPHTICWEHLELVEGSDEPVARQPPAPSPTGTVSRTPSVQEGSSTSQHHDEHCPIAVDLHNRSGVVHQSTSSSVYTGLDVSEPWASPAPIRIASFPLHLLAPSHSPPVL